MILVDLNESYHIPSSQKSFFLVIKRYLIQSEPSKKNLCNTTRQRLSKSPSFDLT
jgi:hypothetical protein